MKKIKLISGLVASLLSFQANAVFVYDPLNYGQNAASAYSLAKQVQQSIQQTKHQFEQLSKIKDNMKNLSQFHWKDLNQAINQLANDVQKGQAIAFSMSNIEDEFRKRFPGIEKTAKGKVNYRQKYLDWVKTNQHTMSGTLKALNSQYNNMKKEQSIRETLLAQAKSPTGSMQAIQAGNEIAAEQINQMQQLRQVMIANASANAEYQAFEAQKAAQSEAAITDIIENAGDNDTKYDGSGGFGQFKSFK